VRKKEATLNDLKKEKKRFASKRDIFITSVQKDYSWKEKELKSSFFSTDKENKNAFFCNERGDSANFRQI
jgi:hypothetical protein